MPTHFNAAPLSLNVEATIYSVFRAFSEETIPYVAVYLLCLWEKVSSGSSHADFFTTFFFCTTEIFLFHALNFFFKFYI